MGILLLLCCTSLLLGRRRLPFVYDVGDGDVKRAIWFISYEESMEFQNLLLFDHFSHLLGYIF